MSDQSVLQLLARDREEVTRSLANIMKAIERGIFNETTKARMDELEQRRSEIDDKIAIEQCKHQNRLTKDKVISYLTDPLRQAPRRLIRALIEKIIVFDDKIQIFFKYTKTSPADTPWEMPAYPGSDSSNMVDLRGLLRRNRFSARSPTPCCASCRLRRGDRVALLRRPSSLFPRAARSSGRSTTKKGRPFAPLHGCAGYFGAIVSPHAPPHPLAPRAAFGGATALRCSAVPALCFHAQRVLPAGPPQKNAADAAFFCGGPARARTAVLQSSSADTTRLVCDQISPAGSPQTTCSLGTLP